MEFNKIIIFGPNGGGKSTFAKNLANGTGIKIHSFAEPIKKIVHDVKGEPKGREDKEANFREAYLTIGRTYRDLFGESVWFDMMGIDDLESYIFDDGRYMHEYEYAAKDNKILTIYIDLFDNGFTDSDLEIIKDKCDIIITDFDRHDEILKDLRGVAEFSVAKPSDIAKPTKDDFKSISNMQAYVHSLGIDTDIKNVPSGVFGVSAKESLEDQKLKIEYFATSTREVTSYMYLAAITLKLGYNLDVMDKYMKHNPQYIITDRDVQDVATVVFNHGVHKR